MPSQTKTENAPTSLREDFEKASIMELWRQFVDFPKVVSISINNSAREIQNTIIESRKRMAEEALPSTPLPAGKNEWVAPNIETGVRSAEAFEIAIRNLTAPGGTIDVRMAELQEELDLLKAIFYVKLQSATNEERTAIASQKIG